MLRPSENVHHNGETIAEIYRNLGTPTADRMMTRALGELTTNLAELAARVRAREVDDAPRRIRRLRSMAENLGMTTLAGVARDAATCLEAGDDTAFAAVWARFLRVAEHSLSSTRGLAGRTS